MQTTPPEALRAEPAGQDEFRLGTTAEIASVLRRLSDDAVPLDLQSDEGPAVRATLWSIDAPRGSICLGVDDADPALPALLERDDAVVVGLLDSVKVQFDALDMVLVHGARGTTLRCGYPAEIYRFQRRGAFRVRPLLRGTPHARVRHSEIAEMQLALRILDVSIGGCALFLPDDVPPMRPGQILNLVQMELDADIRVGVALRLQHVTSLNADSRGVRLGCEFLRTDADTLRLLQRFIDQTQKRGKVLARD